MAESSLLIQNLINATKEQFFYHGRRVDQLKQKEYPFNACEDMLNALSKIDDAILNELDKLEKELSKSQIKKKTVLKQNLERIRGYGQLIEILHYPLTFFEMGNREYIPEGIVVLIDNIVKRFDKNAVFVLVPIHYYNYTYLDLMKPLKKALRYTLPNIDELLSGSPEKYAVFGFPLIQKENSIYNSILAHEVGHFVDEVKKISHKLMGKVSLDPKIVDRIAKRLETSFVGRTKEIKLTYFVTPEEVRATITSFVVARISEWLKELVADAIAFHLVGPIFLFSLTSFLVTMIDIDEATGDHPPPRMRINLLLDQFEKLDYPSVIENIDAKHLEIAEKFVALVHGIPKLLESVEEGERDDIAELTLSSVQEILPNLLKEVRKEVTIEQYSPEEFKAEVFKLTELLDFVIPPAETEIGKPASIASILNVGSVYELMLIDNLYKVLEAKKSKERTIARHRLHMLILKALELSSIETRMKQSLES